MNVGTVRGEPPGAHTPAQGEGCDHAECRHEQRGPADLEHLTDRRFETDLEQQEQDSDLREHVDERVGLEGLEARESREGEVPQKNPRDELAQHRRLAHPHGQVAAELRREQNHDQPKGNRGYGVITHRAVDHSC